MFSKNKRNAFIYGLILLLMLIYAGMISLGQFELTIGTRLQEDSFKVNENYYFGYKMDWKGPIKPVIKNIEVRRKNGRSYEKHDKEVDIRVYVDTTGHTGVLNEEMYQELIKNNRINYREISNYRVEEDFTLMFKVKKNSDTYEEDFGELVVDYKILGSNRRQVLEFTGFSCK